MEVLLARAEHLDGLSKLFDQYRVFYDQTSDIEAAKIFLHERLQCKDSVIFIAMDAKCIVGFTQLFPSFSSVSMRRTWILNDLFVEESYRKQGVAKLLMGEAQEYAHKTGAVRITLATQITNNAAQNLYASLGYRRNDEFYHYAFQLL
jgi:GNAT superfamily N-acetyltransferase